ncbi:MAG: hypothetical protein AAGE94_26130, partial [Acidobacteriota bacterium]
AAGGDPVSRDPVSRDPVSRDPVRRLLRAKRLGHRVDVLMARRTIARSACSDSEGCRDALQRDILQRDTIRRDIVQRDGDEAAAQLIADDAASLGPGQIDRETFLAELRAAVGEIANEILAEIGQTSDDCPYITYWFAYYGGRNAMQIENAVHRFAPTTVDSTSWQDVVSQVADRVGEGLRNFVETGSVAAIPEELPDDLHDEEASEKLIQRCCWGDDTGAADEDGGGAVLDTSAFTESDIPASQEQAPGLQASTVRELAEVDADVEALLTSALSRFPFGKLKSWRGTCYLAAYEFEQAIKGLGFEPKAARVRAGGSDHYFVVVNDGRDNLIVDPTWRQFTSNGSISASLSAADAMIGTMEEITKMIDDEASRDAGLAANKKLLLSIYAAGLTALDQPKYFVWSGK